MGLDIRRDLATRSAAGTACQQNHIYTPRHVGVGKGHWPLLADMYALLAALSGGILGVKVSDKREED